MDTILIHKNGIKHGNQQVINATTTRSTFNGRFTWQSVHSKAKYTGRQGKFTIVFKYKYRISCFYKTYLHIELWRVCKGNKELFLWMISPLCRPWAAGSSLPLRSRRGEERLAEGVWSHTCHLFSLCLSSLTFCQSRPSFWHSNVVLKLRHIRMLKEHINRLLHDMTTGSNAD